MKQLTLILMAVLLLTIFAPVVESTMVTKNEFLVIQEDEILRYSDQILFLERDLQVKGTLILDNVTLLLNATEHNDYRVEDGGNFVMKNSEMMAYQSYVTPSITYGVSEGWNMLSFPLYREDDSLRAVLEPFEGNYDKVYYYDAHQDSWKSYVFGRPEHFNSLKEINRSMAVEIHFTGGIEVNTKGFLPDNMEYDLKKGSNYISYPLSGSIKSGEFLSDVIHDVNKVETVINGETQELAPEDYMIPGKGYNVKMNKSALLTIDVPKGISDNRASSMTFSGGIGFTFDKGSSGTIQNSIVRGYGNEEGSPDIMIRSSSVSVENSVFTDNVIAVQVEEASPKITYSDFTSYAETGIKLRNSSALVSNNNFASEINWGIRTYRGTPLIEKNNFTGRGGIRTTLSSATITNNYFTNINENGLYLDGGVPLIEDNTFSNIERASIRTQSSDFNAKNNVFSDNSGGIYSTDGITTIIDNQFVGNGYGINLQGVISNSTVSGNYFWNTLGWSIKISDSPSVNIRDNTIRSANYGMRLSGKYLRVENNEIKNCLGTGVMISSSQNVIFKENRITDNSDVGFEIVDSSGIAYDNRIIGNSGGALLSADIHFLNNTVANNRIFGITVNHASPFIENAIISGNSHHGIKFEDSDSIVKTSSIIGSDYHLYLLSSHITSINSYFDNDAVWIDQLSDLDIIHNFNLSMKEDEELYGFNLSSMLPPGAVITGVKDHGNVSITVNDDGNLDILPPQNYYDIVNFTLNLNVFDSVKTTFPITLMIEPVNDPPILNVKEFDISYKPTYIRWVVSYTDVDEEPPRYIELVVDGDHYPMKELNETDTSFADGKLYYYEMYLDPGEHVYYIITEENNPLGPNVTVRTALHDFKVSPPVQEMTSFTLAFGGLSLVIFIIVLFLLFSDSVLKRKKNILDDDMVECVDSEEDVSTQCMIEELEKDLDELDRKRMIVQSLPVLKKRESIENKRKLRTVSESSDELVSDPDEVEEPESIIDEVGDVDPDDEDINEEKAGSRKRRFLKYGEKRIVKQKHRVVKTDSGIKKKHR